MNKKIILLSLILVLIKFSYAIPTGGLTYWNLTGVNDLWGSYDATNNGCDVSTDYPSFHTSGNAGDDSFSCVSSNGDYIEASSIADGISTGDALSISFWVKSTYDWGSQSSYAYFISMYYDDSNRWYMEDLGNGNIRMLSYVGGSSQYSDQTPSTLGLVNSAWNHIVLMSDGSTNTELWINGENTYNFTYYLYTGFANTGDLWFMRHPYSGGQYPFSGNIDDVKIFDSALTSTQISNLYNYGEVSHSSDTTPPATVTNLEVESTGTTWIKWNWTNPTADFDHCNLYLDGSSVGTTSNNYYNATGLSSGASYTLNITTEDTSGNINTTQVSNTTSTSQISYSGWTYSVQINISNPNSYNLRNYSVELSLNDTTIPNFDWNNQGNDIRLNTSTKKDLGYWIKDFDSASKTIDLWAKVDELTANSNTTLTLYYGNDDATAQTDVDKAFILYDDFGDADKVKFKLTTDEHYSQVYSTWDDANTRLDNLVSQMNQTDGYDFMISLGDTADEYQNSPTYAQSVEQLETMRAIQNKSRIPYYCTPGNHEFWKLTLSDYLNHSQNCNLGNSSGVAYYSFDYKKVHFIVLDDIYKDTAGTHWNTGSTSPYYVSTPELSWLESDLTSTTYPSVVFLHVPICNYSDSSDYIVQNRATVRSYLENNGTVIAVFEGHDHPTDLIHNQINGIHYFIVPSFTAQSSTINASVDITVFPNEGYIQINLTNPTNNRIDQRYNFTRWTVSKEGGTPSLLWDTQNHLINHTQPTSDRSFYYNSYKNINLNNYKIKLRAKSSSGDIGIIFGWKNITDHWLLEPTTTQSILYQRVSGSYYNRNSTSVSYSADTFYNFTIIVNGSIINATQDSTTIVYYTSATSTIGEIGTRGASGVSEYYSSFIVTPYAENEVAIHYSDGSSTPTSTCSCPSPASNWEINMSNSCSMASCDTTDYNLTFTGTGTFEINGTVKVSTINDFVNGQTLTLNNGNLSSDLGFTILGATFTIKGGTFQIGG